MSNHIKRMLNGPLNKSSIVCGSKKKGKMSLSKKSREYKMGSRGKTTKNSTSRYISFNKTQKINIDEHLEERKALDDLNYSKICNKDINKSLNKNSSTNKFRLILGKNDEKISKYSCIGSSGYERGIGKHLADYKGYNNKTPSHNSRITQKTKRKQIEDKNSHFEADSKRKNKENSLDEQPNEAKMWKNLTQKDIFKGENTKLSGISPSSTKNTTSHFLRFNLEKYQNYDEPNLELPEGLKDLEDDGLEVQEYDEVNANSIGEDLSTEENGSKCFTKSKMELFQTNIRECQFGNKVKAYRIPEEPQHKPTEKTILLSQERDGYIDLTNEEEKNMTSNIRQLKEKIGEFIDSSGGTNDAVELLQQPEPQQDISAVPEMQSSHLHVDNSENDRKAIKDKYVHDDSENETKRRLRELTNLEKRINKKPALIDYP